MQKQEESLAVFYPAANVTAGHFLVLIRTAKPSVDRFTTRARYTPYSRRPQFHLLRTLYLRFVDPLALSCPNSSLSMFGAERFPLTQLRCRQCRDSTSASLSFSVPKLKSSANSATKKHKFPFTLLERRLVVSAVSFAVDVGQLSAMVRTHTSEIQSLTGNSELDSKCCVGLFASD